MTDPRSYTVRPIGFVHSPFVEKIQAPRQATVAEDVGATIEILPEFEHALADLEGFERIWIVFWFDRAESEGFRSKVLPPRSDRKRGVFATRSPHRPNPIGLSAVRLDHVEGRILHVRDVDLLDGTPVLDVKPYLAYADAFPEAGAGWLEKKADPIVTWEVRFSELAEAQLAWIAEQVSADPEGLRDALDLRARTQSALALGPEPHPYRRIKRTDEGDSMIAIKDWRARFTFTGHTIEVQRFTSGYRSRELAKAKTPAEVMQRAFVARFG